MRGATRQLARVIRWAIFAACLGLLAIQAWEPENPQAPADCVRWRADNQHADAWVQLISQGDGVTLALYHPATEYDWWICVETERSRNHTR